MNRFHNERKGLQTLLGAIAVLMICCFTTFAGAQPAPTAPAQCEEYTRATTVTLARGRNVSILTMLATAWEGLTDAEGTSYLNRGEMPRRVLLRSAWPTRDASITSSWAPPAANVPLLTMGQLVIDNPGHWTARYHKIFIVDLPEAVHINRSLSVSVTENVRELPAIPVQIGYRRDRIDVTTLGRLVAQPSATATTVEQLFTADASWFHLPAGAVSQRTYSNWKVETLTGFSDRSRTFSIRRIGARRALQRSCEALPRVDSVIAGEDRAQLAELLVELDGVGSDPDAQSDLQSAVTAAHGRVVAALSQQLRPDREAIASATRGRDGWRNAAIKNGDSARAWRRTFNGYRALVIRNAWIGGLFAALIIVVLFVLIMKKTPVITVRDSTPPDGSRSDHRNSSNPGELPAPQESRVVETRIIDSILATAVRALCEKIMTKSGTRLPTDNSLAGLVGAADAATNKLGVPSTPMVLKADGKDITDQSALDALLTATRTAAKAEGVTEGKAAAPTPEKIEELCGIARSAGYGDGYTAGAASRNGEITQLSGRIEELERTASATAIRHDAKVREIEAERDGWSERYATLREEFGAVFVAFFANPLPVTAEGYVARPFEASRHMEDALAALRAATPAVAHAALQWIKKNASKGPKAIVRAARQGLGEKVEQTGASPAASHDPHQPVTAPPGDGRTSSGVVRTSDATEAADDHPTEQIFATDELLVAVADQVEAELVELTDEPAPAVPNEDYRLAAKLFNAGFRRLYGRVLNGERIGNFAPGAAHAIGQAVAVLRNMLEGYGYEAEAIDLTTNFTGCPEIIWNVQTGMRDKSHGATTQLVDVTPDGRTPQRLVIDRYCAIASFMNRVASGGTEVSLKPEVKTIFDDEIRILTEELRAADNNFAADALVDGLTNTSKSVRTGALPRAKVKAPASVEKTG